MPKSKSRGRAPPRRRCTGSPTLLQETLRQIDLLTEARRARIVKAAGTVPGLLWFVLVAGAVVTVGFTFFFGNENLRAQTLMTGGLTMLVCSGLFVIAAIDQPFAGAVKVGPEALVEVLGELGGVRLPHGGPAPAAAIR